jgi:dihydrodipicolinate synthase/N-acetylneuraminate lyase
VPDSRNADRNNGDPGAADRFRRITEAYEYLSAHLKQHANGHTKTGRTTVTNGTGAGMPAEHSEAASGVLEETWQALRARHRQIPPVVIIMVSGRQVPYRDLALGRIRVQRTLRVGARSFGFEYSSAWARELRLLAAAGRTR